ncbi:hypothetical protein G6F50_016086 [Rhizopus delemar]|uniref:Uncharacterized protein n=1 Tax=Rhizopus delemar TaxID=936053 RepID=A0A9P7C2E4_9FUNG|nr:hypothetical protein G6F50_016086 [Rhizopus delemar]
MQPIEDRQHGGVCAHRRGDRVNRAVQVVGLAAEDDQVERSLRGERGQGIGSDMLHRETGIAQRAADDQSVAVQLGGACWADQEGHVHASLGQPTAEVTAGTAGTENQDAHCTFTVSGGIRPAIVPEIAGKKSRAWARLYG